MISGYSLSGLLDAFGAPTPTPGAGPAVAVLCAVAAALVEMVSGIATGDDDAARTAALACRERAHELRLRALELAQSDVTAYEAVLAARRQAAGPDRTRAIRGALAAAADPPLAIAQLAAEIARLAADAGTRARGGVRGEAETAAILADAAVAACAPMLTLNLAGHPNDPRRQQVRELIAEASQQRQRIRRTR